MDLLATLRRSGGVSAVAVQLDEAPAQVDQGVEALLPLLVSEMRAEVARLGGGDEGIAALLMMLVGGYMSARSAGTGAAGSGGPRELGELYEDLLR